MYIIIGYVQIFWYKLLGKQHYIESYKAKVITIKIDFWRNLLATIRMSAFLGLSFLMY